MKQRQKQIPAATDLSTPAGTVPPEPANPDSVAFNRIFLRVILRTAALKLLKSSLQTFDFPSDPSP
jgi:hypothetical protein